MRRPVACALALPALLAGLVAAAEIPEPSRAPWRLEGLGDTCGDRLLGQDETCDDGNAVEGDGCSDTCRIEPGWTCTVPVPPVLFENVVADGSFEAGSPNPVWEEVGDPFLPLCSDTTCGLPFATDGHWYAWFGGVIAEHVQSLSQTLVIPPSADTLEFMLWVESCDSLDDVLEVSLDGQVVFTTDPCTRTGSYVDRSVDLNAAPGGPYNDGQAHLLRIEGRFFTTQEKNSNMFLDEVRILRPLDPPRPPVPSSCDRVAEACYLEEFTDGLAGWTTFQTGNLLIPWGTTDDGFCGSGDVPPANYTGGSGAAACADSDAAGFTAVDAYLCSPRIDLSRSELPLLRFLYNYQVFNLTQEDLFQVLVGIVPPSPANIVDYVSVFEARASRGIRFGEGAQEFLPLSPLAGQERVWVCYRYRALYDLYAQVDEVQILGRKCRDLKLDVGGTCPGAVTVDVFGATPGGLVAVLRGSWPGSTTIPAGPCAGTRLDLAAPQLVTLVPADGAGRIEVSRDLAAAACGHAVQILDLGSCLTSRPVITP